MQTAANTLISYPLVTADKSLFSFSEVPFTDLFDWWM